MELAPLHIRRCVMIVPSQGPPVSSAEVIVSRKLRIILVSIGIFVLVLLIVPFLIPVNQFRPTIEEKASAALGRKVTLV